MPFSDFPAGDAAAAKAWLADKSHRDFKEWDSAVLNDSKAWANLVKTLSDVVGLKPGPLLKCMKGIVAQRLSQVDTKIHVALDTKKEMAGDVAAEILSRSNTEWKDESREWLDGALTAAIPKIIRLWKKTMYEKTRCEETRHGSQMSAEDGRSQDDLPSSTKAPKRGPRGVADGGLPRAKKVKTNATNSKGEQREERASTSNTTGDQRPLTLPERLIEVRFDKENFILVAASAILKDKSFDCPAEDLREEHLDYSKLLILVESVCAESVTLHWGKENRAIRDEEDFTHAVGVMRFSLEKLSLEKATL